MSSLNAAAVLAVWEEGSSQPPLRRALTLLATAWPETCTEAWAAKSIGRRDASLLDLREEMFGSKLDATTTCPQCRQRLEVAIDTGDIRAVAPPCPPDLRVEAHGYEVACRLPNSTDLLAITALAEGGERLALLRRCVSSVRLGDTVADSGALPDEVIASVMSEMAKADPQADVHVGLTCPACGHSWSMAFDILSYLWNEIDDLAQRLLREVSALASAYGWSERDILSMTARRRRRLYLEMLES